MTPITSHFSGSDLCESIFTKVPAARSRSIVDDLSDPRTDSATIVGILMESFECGTLDAVNKIIKSVIKHTGTFTVDPSVQDQLRDLDIDLSQNRDGTVRMIRHLRSTQSPARHQSISLGLAPFLPDDLINLVSGYDQRIEISTSNLPAIKEIILSDDWELKSQIIRDVIHQGKQSMLNAVFSEIRGKLPLQHVDLSGLNLTGLHLQRVNFQYANLALTTLTGINLAGTSLEQANLTNAELQGARLGGADFHETNLTGANLTGAELTSCFLMSTDLTGANLSAANLSHVSIDNTSKLAGTNLCGAKLKSANIAWGMNMSGANLNGADLSHAMLFRVTLAGANFSGANLSEIFLDQADLTGADFTEANLTGANLSGANLTGAKLVNTILTNTNFSDAIMTNVKHHSQGDH